MSMMQLVGANAFVKGLNDFADSFQADRTYVVYTNVEHGLYQEYGTIYQSGQPHFRPAVQEAAGNLGSYVSGSATLEAGLERTAQQIAASAARMAPVDTGELRNSYTVSVA